MSGSLRKVVPARLSSVSQPAFFAQPSSLSRVDAGGLVVVECVIDAVRVEPGARLLHGVAVLDAVDGDGFGHPAPTFAADLWTGGAARQDRRRSFHRFFGNLSTCRWTALLNQCQNFFLDQFRIYPNY